MHLTLSPHPAAPIPRLSAIGVDILAIKGSRLTLGYSVTGQIDDLLIASPGPSARADGLWRRTCFEAFVRIGAGPAYYEFNFAPSGEWAAYSFSAYREGMSAVTAMRAPTIEAKRTKEMFVLNVCLTLDQENPPAIAAPWRVGLAAVMEGRTGEKSYWALTHPRDTPDFHHADGFVCALTSAEAA